MNSYGVDYPRWTSWAGPVGVLAAVGAAVLGLWITQGASLPLRSAVGLAILVLASLAIWAYRIRAARRLFAALDAYAERELERAKRRRRATRSRNKRALSQ